MRARAVLERLAPGDVALVKGSLATRMEQIVRLLMDEPHLAPDLLVRQDAGVAADRDDLARPPHLAGN